MGIRCASPFSVVTPLIVCLMTLLEIYNNALGLVGEPQLASTAATTPAGRACNLHFDLTRDAVLRSHRWNFATKRAALVAATTPAFGWGYAYTLPTDFLRVTEVNESADAAGAPWAIEGALLLTDFSSVNLVYVYRLTDVALFEPLFCEALILRLAEKIAPTLRGGSVASGVDFGAKYLAVTAPLARRIDANEGRARTLSLPLESSFVRARGRDVGGWE